MKQRSIKKTENCRVAPRKHGIYSAEMYSAREYLRRLKSLLKMILSTSPIVRENEAGPHLVSANR